MDHYIYKKDYDVVNVGNLKIYVKSYDISRKRRYSILNGAEKKLFVTDNGAYPAYIKLRGYILRLENSTPVTLLYNYVENSYSSNLNIDGIYFKSAKIVNFNIHNDPVSKKLDCEIEFSCKDGIISETWVE